ncbi:MAG: hypothetical protein QM679_10640 [Patulibacter sp.]
MFTLAFELPAHTHPAHVAGRRIASVALAALAVAAVLASPGTAGADQLTPASDACNEETLKALIIAHDAELAETWESWGDRASTGTTPLSVICRTIDGDELPDALWVLGSGGTGGALHAGIATSGSGGAPAVMAEWVDGYRLTTGLYRGRAAIAWPKYRKADPNCCASGGWRWRFYGPASGGGVHRSKLRKSRKTTWPLKLAHTTS